MRVTLVQIDTTVGDIDGNLRRIREEIREAAKGGAELVAFPELALTGYPPEDLLLHPQFSADSGKAMRALAKEVRDVVAIVGFVEREGGEVYNAAGVCAEGRLVGVARKCRLPNYGVFDEFRTFTPGRRPLVLDLGRARVAINICEDIWFSGDPTRIQVEEGRAHVILNLSASPYHQEKPRRREAMLRRRAREAGAYVLYCNLVGGQDELIFDGSSAAIAPDGRVLARAPSMREFRLRVEVDPAGASRRWTGGDEAMGNLRVARVAARLPKKEAPFEPSGVTPFREPVEEMFEALVLGIRDYVKKNGFTKVVLGLSGGIDSAAVAVLAVEALGRENVVAVSMPSKFSTRGSKTDAAALAKNLGIALRTIPISRVYDAYRAELGPHFEGRPFDVTEENLQARIRGNYLMALSNKMGWLVLSTGDKSETSMGYCTLYGDMSGGFAPNKDVYKTRVYELCRYYNRLRGRVIPEAILAKPPSPELRAKQLAEDTLPPYELLDPVLEAYVERNLTVPAMVRELRGKPAWNAAYAAAKRRGHAVVRSTGSPEGLVRWIVNRVDRNEYKRRQAPPGIKVTPRAFGKDRRMPITSRYRL